MNSSEVMTKSVGWAKRSVPTFASTNLKVGTALARLCPPYAFRDSTSLPRIPGPPPSTPAAAEQRLDMAALRPGQANEHRRVIAVVIGEVIDFRLALDQHLALVLRHAEHDQRLVIFPQPRQKLLAHLERRRAVGRAVLDFRPRQRKLADVIEGHPLAPSLR